MIRNLILLTLTVILSNTIGCSSVEKEWQSTKQTNTLEIYKSFIKKHPDGQYADSARVILEKLEFVMADSIGTEESYNSFITAHLDDKYADSARYQLMCLAFAKARETNTIEAYNGFAKKYQGTDFANKTKIIIDSIIEVNEDYEDIDPKVLFFEVNGGKFFGVYMDDQRLRIETGSIKYLLCEGQPIELISGDITDGLLKTKKYGTILLRYAPTDASPLEVSLKPSQLKAFSKLK